MENELLRKKKAMELAQEDINAANSRINELSKQINDLLSTNNDLLVCTSYDLFLLNYIQFYHKIIL